MMNLSRVECQNLGLIYCRGVVVFRLVSHSSFLRQLQITSQPVNEAVGADKRRVMTNLSRIIVLLVILVESNSSAGGESH